MIKMFFFTFNRYQVLSKFRQYFAETNLDLHTTKIPVKYWRQSDNGSEVQGIWVVLTLKFKFFNKNGEKNLFCTNYFKKLSERLIKDCVKLFEPIYLI